MKKQILITGLALAASVLMIQAQDEGNQNRRPGPGGPGGPRMFGGPLLEALDANKDGELDAAEIENAAAALKKLDKNADGKITVAELRPQRPGGGGPGGPGGPRAPRGEGRPQRGDR